MAPTYATSDKCGQVSWLVTKLVKKEIMEQSLYELFNMLFETLNIHKELMACLVIGME